MTYFYNEDGSLQVGWIGNKYIEDSTGEYIKSTFATIDNHKYYFDENGNKKTGMIEIDVNTYFMNDDGVLV